VYPELAIRSRSSVLSSKGQQRDEKKDTDPHDTLTTWFQEQKDDPYPSRDEKNLLSTRTGLDMVQINNRLVDSCVRKQSSMSNYSVTRKSATSTEESSPGSQYTDTSERSGSESGSSVWTDYLESDTEPCYEGCEALDSLRFILACRLLETYQTRPSEPRSCGTSGSDTSNVLRSSSGFAASEGSSLPSSGKKRARSQQSPATAVDLLMVGEDEATRLEMARQTKTSAFWLARSTRRITGSTDAAISTYYARSTESSKSFDTR